MPTIVVSSLGVIELGRATPRQRRPMAPGDEASEAQRTDDDQRAGRHAYPRTDRSVRSDAQASGCAKKKTGRDVDPVRSVF